MAQARRKKKVSKKTAAKKTAAKKKASKKKAPRKKAPRKKVPAEGSKLATLAAAGIFDPQRLTAREIRVINSRLTDEEVSALISAHRKLVGRGGPIAFVCF